METVRKSIYLQTLIVTSVILVIVIMLAAATIFGMMVIDDRASALEQTWIGEATLLGNIDYSVTAFRLAEAYRELARDADMRNAAEGWATDHRHEVDTKLQQYTTMLAIQAPAELTAFTENWTVYKARHDAWVNADGDGSAAAAARTGSSLAGQYLATDASIDALIDAHEDEGQARASAVGRVARITIGITASMAVAVVVAAALMMNYLRRRLIVPLRSMTRTMRLLAAGDHHVQVPSMTRLDEVGEMARACEVFRVNVLALENAHQAVRSAEEQARKLARHDALTGLPNRRVFAENLDVVIASSRQVESIYSVLLIDLDGFKKVNDILGHRIGDMVLCEVANRLERNVRKQDTVARLGGDEFAIIAPDYNSLKEHLEGMKLLAARLISAIGHEMIFDGNTVDIGASIGIAHCRAGDAGMSGSLHAADIAMYRAKQSGRGTFRFFEQSMDDELRAQEVIERDLARAVAAEEIVPYYQPLVDIGTMRIRGFEALARWKHPIRGFVPPDIFIPIAERLNLMSKLTSSILHQACRAAKQWPADTKVSVNFPPSAFEDPDLSNWILDILNSEGFPPARLEIEITENALVTDIEGARKILAALQDVGIMICLDDFGTGYSSLNHLRELRFDKVKIDRSFVQTLGIDVNNEKIIDAILHLTKSLGLSAVAEGIESAATLEQLRLKGCEFGQGFFFAQAIDADAARDMANQADVCTVTA